MKKATIYCLVLITSLLANRCQAQVPTIADIQTLLAEVNGVSGLVTNLLGQINEPEIASILEWCRANDDLTPTPAVFEAEAEAIDYILCDVSAYRWMAIQGQVEAENKLIIASAIRDLAIAEFASNGLSALHDALLREAYRTLTEAQQTISQSYFHAHWSKNLARGGAGSNFNNWPTVAVADCAHQRAVDLWLNITIAKQ